MIMHF
jgi:hypothetical protein